MNFMRQAQVSAMVRNAIGHREWRSLGRCMDVRVETVECTRPPMQQLIDEAVQRQITRTCARPPLAGLTTEAPAGRYQGIGFRSE